MTNENRRQLAERHLAEAIDCTAFPGGGRDDALIHAQIAQAEALLLLVDLLTPNREPEEEGPS